MNKEWQSFLDENRTLISEYEKKMQDDQKAKSDLINKLKTKLQERIDNEKSSIKTELETYSLQGSASHSSLVINIFVDKNIELVIEPYFINASCKLEDFQHFGVLYLAIWVRQSRQNKCREEGLDIIKKALSRKSISYKERDIKGWGWGKSIETDQFDFSKDVKEQDVEDAIFELWKTIVGI